MCSGSLEEDDRCSSKRLGGPARKRELDAEGRPFSRKRKRDNFGEATSMLERAMRWQAHSSGVLMPRRAF